LLVVSSVKDVGPRRLGYHRIPRAAERNGRVDLLARARMQPVPPIEPPASFPFLGGSEERIGSPDFVVSAILILRIGSPAALLSRICFGVRY
jgi:hypothetical protein